MAATQEKPKKKMPERKCVGCNERKPKNELVRVLRTPEGEIAVDRTGKKSGRGAYLCQNAACLEKAQKGHKLEKSFSCKVAPEVYEVMMHALSEADGTA